MEFMWNMICFRCAVVTVEGGKWTNRSKKRNQSAWHASVTYTCNNFAWVEQAFQWTVWVCVCGHTCTHNGVLKLCHRDFMLMFPCNAFENHAVLCSCRCVFTANTGLYCCHSFIFFFLLSMVWTQNQYMFAQSMFAFQIWYSITSIYLCYARTNKHTYTCTPCEFFDAIHNEQFFKIRFGLTEKAKVSAHVSGLDE